MILAHQSAEFRFVIKDKVLTAYLLDLCMVTRNRDVSHSDLTVVTATQLDTLGRDVLNDHHVVGFLRDSLEDYMVAFGLFDGE